MCGIAGRIAPTGLSEDRRSAALAAMARRGPDGIGSHSVRIAAGRHVDLLHSRLSIQDLNARSDQPLRRDGLTLIFNGEILNFPELRLELERHGYRFLTSGDSEVLLLAWRHWGEGALDRLIGQFAFAVLEDETGRITLVRDRVGEKPLHLWQPNAESVFFGSEIKALVAMAGTVPPIDQDHLRRYLVNGYKSLARHGRTFLHGIREVPPAHFVRIEPDGSVTQTRYWAPVFTPQQMCAGEAQERVNAALETAVARSLRADIPVALRLSGGIDSTVAAGIAHLRQGAEIACFSIIEDDWRYDESAMIKLALDHLDVRNHQIRIPKSGFLERLEAMVGYFDGPPLTISYYLHDLVSEAIHQEGYKVSLGGTGADEIFSGYYDHYLFWLATQSDAPDFEALVAGWRNSYGRFVRNPHLQNPHVFTETPEARDHIFLDADQFADYLTDPFDEPHAEVTFTDDLLRNRMLNELQSETVPIMLHDDDLAAMRWSVENRAIYMDRDLIETLLRIPTRHLIQDGLPKALLRKAGSGLVPEEILRNPRKQGINAAVSAMVDFTDPTLRDRLLSDSVFFDIVDRKKFETLLSSDVNRNSESKFLFSLLAARVFVDMHCARKV